MRILVVHNTLTDSTSISGVFKHYACMANEWHAMGHEVDFLMARAGEKQLRNLAPHAGLVCSDSLFDATRYIEKTWRYLPAYAYRLLTAFWVRLPRRYDVVVASCPFILEVLNAMTIAWRQKTPWCVKNHHILVAQKKRHGLFDFLYVKTERWSTRLMQKYALGIICSTDIVAQDYARLCEDIKVPPRKIHVIGYGVQLAPEFPFSNNQKDYDVVFLGRIHEHKGIFDLPGFWEKVLKIRPNAKMVVIGEGPQRSELSELVRHHGLTNSITITGGISETEKNHLLHRSRIGLSFSYEEGWGLSITEFMANSLPVVAYHLPVFDTVFPGQLDLVGLGDWEAAADHVLALLDNPLRQSEMAQQGWQFIKRYSLREIATQELTVISSALHPGSSPRVPDATGQPCSPPNRQMQAPH